jgi:hypothetical protein
MGGCRTRLDSFSASRLQVHFADKPSLGRGPLSLGWADRAAAVSSGQLPSVTGATKDCLNPRAVVTIDGSSLGDRYVKSHCVVSSGVLNDELVSTILRRRDFHRTLRPGRVVLTDFFARRIVDVQVYVRVLGTVRCGFELFPGRERQEKGGFALVFHFDVLALESLPVAQVGRLLCGTQCGEREYSRCCGD